MSNAAAAAVDHFDDRTQRPQQGRKRVGGVAIVVHHEDAALGKRRRRPGLILAVDRARGQCRQFHDELTPLAESFACGRDRASMHLDETSRECQPDAESALRPPVGTVHLYEHVEDRRQMTRVDADAVVAHGNNGPVASVADRDRGFCRRRPCTWQR